MVWLIHITAWLLSLSILFLMPYRLMSVTSVSFWIQQVLPVYRSIPELVTEMSSSCSVLLNSPPVRWAHCCSSALTSQAPWASPHRWKPPDYGDVCTDRVSWQSDIQAFEFHMFNPSCFKVLEGESLVHRSRLHVSFFFCSFSRVLLFYVKLI